VAQGSRWRAKHSCPKRRTPFGGESDQVPGGAELNGGTVGGIPLGVGVLDVLVAAGLGGDVVREPVDEPVLGWVAVVGC